MCELDRTVLGHIPSRIPRQQLRIPCLLCLLPGLFRRRPRPSLLGGCELGLPCRLLTGRRDLLQRPPQVLFGARPGLVLPRLRLRDDQLLTVERFAVYQRELRAALRRVDEGEHEWLTSPRIDSYHTVWMRLHEDLLLALGVERSSEPTD